MQLNTAKPFQHFDLALSSEDVLSFTKIHIARTDSYDHYGELLQLPLGIASFLGQIGNNSKLLVSRCSQTIANIVDDTLKRLGQETAWISLRAFTPNPVFVKPRWHTDGYYYSPKKGKQYKVALTLKGAGTLFAMLSEDQCRRFVALQRAGADEQLSQLLANAEVESTKIGSATYFIVGPSYSAIHSEPNMNAERLFLSILPGTAAQIDERKNAVVT